MKNIELCAGGGGLALGAELAGFEHHALIEVDKYCIETLKHNRPDWNILLEDLTKITEKDLCEFFSLEKGELDLLSGGVPCQSFSYAGKKLGLEDTRGTLFYHYAKFLKQLQPKMFLFENVRGMLSHDQGKTFEIIKNTFIDCGYNIQYQILNANDYNVAQKRERLIVIGIRKDLNLNFKFPNPIEPKPVLRDILLDCPESKGMSYSKEKLKFFNLIPQGGNWTSLPEELAKAYMGKSYYNSGGKTGILRRLSLDEPSLSILTTPSQKQTERCHPLETRPFTIRECARIQSFPDDWEFIGSISNQYKQIGNAVPVNLAYYICKSIYETLKKETENER